MIGKNSFKNLGPKNYSLQMPLNILLVSKSCLVEKWTKVFVTKTIKSTTMGFIKKIFVFARSYWVILNFVHFIITLGTLSKHLLYYIVETSINVVSYK